jgi:hypothetical protein
MDDIKEEILRINNKYLFENKIENAETIIVNNIKINKVNFNNVKRGFYITEKIEDNNSFSKNNSFKEENNIDIQSSNSNSIVNKKTTKQLKSQKTKAPSVMIKKNKDKDKEKDKKKNNGYFLWCIPKICF